MKTPKLNTSTEATQLRLAAIAFAATPPSAWAGSGEPGLAANAALLEAAIKYVHKLHLRSRKSPRVALSYRKA